MTWLRDDAQTAENLPYLNRFVVQGAVPNGANSWQGKLSYEGDVFEGKMTMVSEDALKLRGCQGMFCKSMNFVRL